jgi:hypothetical protein
MGITGRALTPDTFGFSPFGFSMLPATPTPSGPGLLVPPMNVTGKPEKGPE